MNCRICMADAARALYSPEDGPRNEVASLRYCQDLAVEENQMRLPGCRVISASVRFRSISRGKF